MIRLLLFVLPVLFAASTLTNASYAMSEIQEDDPRLKKVFSSFFINIDFEEQIPIYQIGREWGRKEISEDLLRRETDGFVKIALKTAKFQNSTAFYLGFFNGKHVMATNHHVLNSQDACTSAPVDFLLLNSSVVCHTVLGTWPSIDFTLFTVNINDLELENHLLELAQNMAFHTPIYKGQQLLTVGHGIANNPDQTISSNQDSDCIVFSEKNDVRNLADPDIRAPKKHRVWSFANGCDISHGDSGSPVADKKSGELVGIIWTGRTPKSQRARESAYLKNIYESNSAEIWHELSYAVPATKIYEVITNDIKFAQSTERIKTLRALLED